MHDIDDLSEAAASRESRHEVPFKALLVFGGCVLTAAAVATGIYWAVFGFSHWTTEMTTANKIMLAAANAPGAAPVAPGAGAAGAPCSGQYVCPVHGAVGLPRFDAAGTPRCPVGGEPMQFRSVAAPAATAPRAPQATPAAFAGG